MRGLLVALCMVMGCTDAPIDRDEAAALDSCIANSPPWCRNVGDACTHSWCAAIGAQCSAAVTPFCVSGGAWCSDTVCRQFCSPVAFPRCPAGQTERHERDGNADVCTCE